MQHRAAPDQRLIARAQEAHGDEFDTELFERLDTVAQSHGGLIDPHHQGHVGAINIGVQQSHLMAQRSQADRQIHRHGGLTDTTFPGADGNEILHARDRQLGRLARLIRGHQTLS